MKRTVSIPSIIEGGGGGVYRMKVMVWGVPIGVMRVEGMLEKELMWKFQCSVLGGKLQIKIVGPRQFLSSN
jgi:hypothetical protein